MAGVDATATERAEKADAREASERETGWEVGANWEEEGAEAWRG